MKKHKTKVIIAVAILITLVGTWFLGDTPEINRQEYPTAITKVIESHIYAAESETILPLSGNVVEQDITMQESSTLIEEVASEEQPKTEVDYELEIQISEELEKEVQIFGEDHIEMRAPVEPEYMVVGDSSFVVTLEVRVDMILLNMHLLHRDKHELVPFDGVIFPRTEVIAYEGESVFNVLQREMRRNGIHMASRFTPVFNSAYVEAINNLYEFDVGPLSGWMYRVNGWFPNFGSSKYLLSHGDEIEWQFTVDLGRDLGVEWIDGGQLDE